MYLPFCSFGGGAKCMHLLAALEYIVKAFKYQLSLKSNVLLYAFILYFGCISSLNLAELHN
jgi:hypothetical protein